MHFWFAMLRVVIWFKKLTSLFRPIRRKIKTNLDSGTFLRGSRQLLLLVSSLSVPVVIDHCNYPAFGFTKVKTALIVR